MSYFYAYLARLRLVQRWGLMRGEPENVAEHSFQVAVVAHALAVIGVRTLGRAYDPTNVALAALFHDASEVLTGDLPTPVKYANTEMRNAYKGLEQAATERLLEMLPEALRDDYTLLLVPTDPEVIKLVKAADKLCALLKCVQEVGSGNREFALAEAALRGQLDALDVPEASYFLEYHGDSFSLSLDDLQDAPPDGAAGE